MRKKISHYLSIFFLLFVPVVFLAGCNNGEPATSTHSALQQNVASYPAADIAEPNVARAKVNEESKDSGKYSSLSDLENATFGVITGSNHDEHVKNRLPNARIMYFSSNSDIVSALLSAKIDAMAVDEPVCRNIIAEHPTLKPLSEMLEQLDYGYMFAKTDAGQKDADAISDFMAKLQSDGTLTSLQKKWFDSSDLSNIDMLDYTTLPATSRTFRASTSDNPPFSFLQGNRIVGYDVEVLALFCQQAGYALEVTDYTFDGLISSVVSGKVDCGCGGIGVTDARKESMNFSAPIYSGGTSVLVLNGQAESGNLNFFAAIADAFEKTFIRENRWQLFLSGMLTTLLITFLSIVFGTALGFLVFMLCRRGNKVANVIARFFSWLIQGMPAVVLLMILYYIVFGQVPIAGEAVSIIGFTLIFGSSVFNMLKTGVNTVDKGQTEAALALGYRDSRAFFRIVFPQAIPHIMPSYKGEIVSLIKATAIVGYLAVQDVTKVGDIIRSRTFEPFFPLITIAILYFLLAAVLIFVVKHVEIHINPRMKKNKKLLKGVKQK